MMRINYSRNCLFHLARDITKNLPLKIARNFFDYQERNLFTLFIRDRNRIDKKCDWLIYKRDSTINKNIKSIKYYCLPSDTTSEGNSSSYTNNKKFFLSRPLTCDSSNSLEISISPSSFNNSLSSFSSLYSSKKNWFLNLSNLSIPPPIQHFLQLGDNFSLPNQNKSRLSLNLLKTLRTI